MWDGALNLWDLMLSPGSSCQNCLVWKTHNSGVRSVSMRVKEKMKVSEGERGTAIERGQMTSVQRS